MSFLLRDVLRQYSRDVSRGRRHGRQAARGERSESLGAVHVRVWAKNEDCDEKRSATRSCNGSAFSDFTHGHCRPALKGPNRFKLRRRTAVIFLRGCDGTVLECLVSRKDFHRIRRHHWYVDRNQKGTFYADAWIDGARVQMHKHLCPNWAQVKHENGNGLDNRRENLRGVQEPPNRWV